MRLKGKFAGVTGAAMGMGKCIAETLAAEGASVAVTDLNGELAEEVADGIRKNGGYAKAWKLDVTNRAEIRRVIKEIVEHFGKIDIWVNNAGVSTMKPFMELGENDWDFMHNVNGSGVFFCSQAVANYMIQQGGGQDYQQRLDGRQARWECPLPRALCLYKIWCDRSDSSDGQGIGYL